jgi:hypothetical protein
MDVPGRVIVSNSIALHARLTEIARRIRKVDPRTRACRVRPRDETHQAIALVPVSRSVQF